MVQKSPANITINPGTIQGSTSTATATQAQTKMGIRFYWPSNWARLRVSNSIGWGRLSLL